MKDICMEFRFMAKDMSKPNYMLVQIRQMIDNIEAQIRFENLDDYDPIIFMGEVAYHSLSSHDMLNYNVVDQKCSIFGIKVMRDHMMHPSTIKVKFRYKYDSLAYKYVMHDSLALSNIYAKLADRTQSTDFTKENKMPKIKKVIFNAPATIVYWEDETKTVVKCQSDDYHYNCVNGEPIFDKEKGLAMAIVKKLNGNKGNYNDIFRKWCY